METEHHKNYNFTITYDGIANSSYGLTPKITELLEECFVAIQEHRKGTIKKLKKYVDKYPHIPHFKNHLSIAYAEKGYDLYARQVNDLIIEQHPEYLFGFLNQVNSLLAMGEKDAAYELMKDYNTVQDFAPERKVFHYSEFGGFEVTMIALLLEQDNVEAAESRLPVLKEMKIPGFYEQAAILIEGYWEEQEASKNEYTDETSEYAGQHQVFHHPEIERLYHYDLSVDIGVLQTILELPRHTLIEDLCTVMRDTMSRADYYMQGHGPEEAWWVNFHVMALLTELRANEAADTLTAMLKCDQTWSDYWWGDATTESLPYMLAVIFKDYPTPLHKFLKNIEGQYVFLLTAASQALSDMVRIDVKVRSQVMDIYKDLFRGYLDNKHTITDTQRELIAFMVSDVSMIKGVELGEYIEALYRENLVAEIYSEGWEAEKEMLEDKLPLITLPEFSLAEQYTRWQQEYMQENQHHQNWRNSDLDFTELDELLAQNIDMDDWNDDEWLDEFEDDDYRPPFQQARSNKIGRNEPCPCGSGKKYKRCCGA